VHHPACLPTCLPACDHDMSWNDLYHSSRIHSTSLLARSSSSSRTELHVLTGGIHARLPLVVHFTFIQRAELRLIRALSDQLRSYGLSVWFPAPAEVGVTPSGDIHICCVDSLDAVRRGYSSIELHCTVSHTQPCPGMRGELTQGSGLGRWGGSESPICNRPWRVRAA
jgi:hypothetical protein